MCCRISASVKCFNVINTSRESKFNAKSQPKGHHPPGKSKRKMAIVFYDVVEIFYGPMIVNIDDRVNDGENRLIGAGYQTRINAVLRMYMEARKQSQ
jgi:hypothetical protein